MMVLFPLGNFEEDGRFIYMLVRIFFFLVIILGTISIFISVNCFS